MQTPSCCTTLVHKHGGHSSTARTIVDLLICLTFYYFKWLSVNLSFHAFPSLPSLHTQFQCKTFNSKKSVTIVCLVFTYFIFFYTYYIKNTHINGTKKNRSHPLQQIKVYHSSGSLHEKQTQERGSKNGAKMCDVASASALRLFQEWLVVTQVFLAALVFASSDFCRLLGIVAACFSCRVTDASHSTHHDIAEHTERFCFDFVGHSHAGVVKARARCIIGWLFTHLQASSFFQTWHTVVAFDWESCKQKVSFIYLSFMAHSRCFKLRDLRFCRRPKRLIKYKGTNYLRDCLGNNWIFVSIINGKSKVLEYLC